MARLLLSAAPSGVVPTQNAGARFLRINCGKSLFLACRSKLHFADINNLMSRNPKKPDWKGNPENFWRAWDTFARALRPAWGSGSLLRQPEKLLLSRDCICDRVLAVNDDGCGKIGGPVGRIEARGGLKSATTEIGWPT